METGRPVWHTRGPLTDVLAAVRDPQRLAALRRQVLLDTPPTEAFDRLTRLAARVLDAPVALLTLVVCLASLLVGRRRRLRKQERARAAQARRASNGGAAVPRDVRPP